MLGRGATDQKGRTLKDLLEPSTGHLVIRTRLRFHPMNVMVDLPQSDILLGEPTLLAIATVRTPHLAPPSRDAQARPVVLGAISETAFNARR
jgi:hypothetical protein